MTQPQTPPTNTWDAEALRRLDGAIEVQVASRRADGSLRRYVTIWTVTVGDGVFIRSAYGTDNPWFRRARTSGTGSIRAGGLERAVTFNVVDPGDAVHRAIDAAYHAKYDQYGPKIVGTVVGAEAAAATFTLVPAG